MRICLLTYRGNPFCGGQGVYAMALGEALARRGHEVHCVTGPPYPPSTPGIVWHRVPGLALLTGNGDGNGHSNGHNPLLDLLPLRLYERAAAGLGIFPEMTAFSLRAFGAVNTLLRRMPFDVVHDNQTLGWGMLPLARLAVPLVTTIHHPLTVDLERGFDPPSTFAQRWNRVVFHPVLMQRYVAQRMPHVITVSHASRERIVADFRVRPERIHVVPNGVDTERFRPRPEIARVPGRVLYVGNLEDPNKGGKHLLRMAAHLRPGAHLLIATGGIQEDGWVPRLLHELNLDGRVQFRFGLSADELAPLYNTAEVGVCSSLFEGFGLPAAEAMASGLPLVSARGGALPEVVGDAGVLVPVAQPQALADAVNTLLGDPARREALGQAARERALECFQWDHAAAEVEAVYRKAMAAIRNGGGA